MEQDKYAAKHQSPGEEGEQASEAGRSVIHIGLMGRPSGRSRMLRVGPTERNSGDPNNLLEALRTALAKCFHGRLESSGVSASAKRTGHPDQLRVAAGYRRGGVHEVHCVHCTGPALLA